jgi:hypothetical protein
VPDCHAARFLEGFVEGEMPLVFLWCVFGFQTRAWSMLTRARRARTQAHTRANIARESKPRRRTMSTRKLRRVFFLILMEGEMLLVFLGGVFWL